MPILGLDIDDTSGKYLKALKQYIIEEEQDKFFAGMTAAEIDTHFPAMTSYDSFEWTVINGDREKFKAYHANAVDRGIYANIEPFEGLSDAIWKLKQEHDFQIYVITNRFVVNGQNAKVITDTGLWLDKNNVPYDDIMFTRNKVNVMADVYIDDSKHNIMPLRAAGRKTITYDRTYNRELPGLRAHNWGEAYDLLSRMFQADLAAA